MKQLNCLDLFSGTGGWSQTFLDRGHRVERVENDIDTFANVPYTTFEDVLSYRPRDTFDVVLASPPCQAFSLGAGGTHIKAFSDCANCRHRMAKVHEKWVCRCDSPEPTQQWLEPVSKFGKLSVQLVNKTLSLIEQIQPSFWWMENPNGGMIHFVPESIPRVQVTYCQYGESRMKLTNLWGQWPGAWKLDPDAKTRLWRNVSRGWHPRPRCKNGDPCHETAQRGAKTGTQGLRSSVERAIVPYELSLEVCLAVEEALT